MLIEREPGAATRDSFRALTGSDRDFRAWEQFYGELNEVPSSLSAIEIEHFTPPNMFAPADVVNLATGVHTGEVVLTLTKDLAVQNTSFHGGWGAETYQVQTADPLHTGTKVIFINMNGVAIHLHYIFATTWTP